MGFFTNAKILSQCNFFSHDYMLKIHAVIQKHQNGTFQKIAITAALLNNIDWKGFCRKGSYYCEIYFSMNLWKHLIHACVIVWWQLWNFIVWQMKFNRFCIQMSLLKGFFILWDNLIEGSQKWDILSF